MDNPFAPDRRLFILSSNERLKMRVESTWSESVPSCLIKSINKLPDFLDHCSMNHGSVGIVEMSAYEDRPEQEMLPIHQLVLQRREVCLLAVIDDNWSCSRKLLQIGFRGVFNQTNLSNISNTVRRYWESVAWPSQNVTDLPISNLPWPPID